MFQIFRVWSPTHLADFRVDRPPSSERIQPQPPVAPKEQPQAPLPQAPQSQASQLLSLIEDKVVVSGDKGLLSKEDVAALKALKEKSQDPQYVPSKKELQQLEEITTKMAAQLKGQQAVSLPDDPDARLAMAQDSGTSAAALRALAHDEDSTVRFSVARNPQTPRDELERLAQEDVTRAVKMAALAALKQMG